MIPDTFYSRLFHFFLLSVLVIICYSNALHAPWHFDDFSNIVDNSSIKIKKLSLLEINNVLKSAIHDNGSNKRPVAAITFAINYLFSGNSTNSYHIVNICLHIISALIVYLVFIETVYLYTVRYKNSNTGNTAVSVLGVALLGSVLWAIHPIHTQAVTYIVQRQTVLSAMFCMLAMYCYIKARLSKGALFTIIWIAFGVIFFLLGFGSKQNAALLPLSLIGYEVAFFRTSLRILFMKNKAFHAVTILILAILVPVIFLKGRAFFDPLLSPYGFRTFTMWERLLTQPVILFKYLFLILTPLSDFLCLESDIIVSGSLFDPHYTIVAALAIICLGSLGLYLLNRQPVLGFAIFFFFANHIIESTFIPVELYFEHRNYLPSVFIYLAVSFFFVNIIFIYKEKTNKVMQSIFAIFGILFLVSEGNATYLRNDVWNNEITLMEDAINKATGNIRPYISVSAMYAKAHKYEESDNYLRKAEKMFLDNPSMYQVNMPALLYYNMAMLYTSDWENNDIDKAIGLLYKSIEYSNGYYLSHMNLGLLLFEKGEYGQAELAMKNAYALNTDKSSVFYINFGRILYSNGKVDEAISAFLKGLELNGSDEARLNLVAAYLNKGDFHRAGYLFGQIDKDNTTPAFLLCFALLYPGAEGDSALDKLVGLMVNNGVSYCEWLEKIIKNNLLGIIYPDIQSVESKLKIKYLDYLSRILDKIDATQEKAKGCNRSVVERAGVGKDSSLAVFPASRGRFSSSFTSRSEATTLQRCKLNFTNYIF